MSEMVERVAAILKNQGGYIVRGSVGSYEILKDGESIEWCSRSPADRIDELLARDIISAMREPTKQMMDNPPQWVWLPKEKWQHFIDEALK